MDDPCKGCMHQPGKGRNRVCTVCSRLYMDKYKPTPPPKPLSPTALSALVITETLIQTTPRYCGRRRNK